MPIIATFERATPSVRSRPIEMHRDAGGAVRLRFKDARDWFTNPKRRPGSSWSRRFLTEAEAREYLAEAFPGGFIETAVST